MSSNRKGANDSSDCRSQTEYAPAALEDIELGSMGASRMRRVPSLQIEVPDDNDDARSELSDMSAMRTKPLLYHGVVQLFVPDKKQDFFLKEWLPRTHHIITGFKGYRQRNVHLMTSRNGYSEFIMILIFDTSMNFDAWCNSKERAEEVEKFNKNKILMNHINFYGGEQGSVWDPLGVPSPDPSKQKQQQQQHTSLPYTSSKKKKTDKDDDENVAYENDAERGVSAIAPDGRTKVHVPSPSRIFLQSSLESVPSSQPPPKWKLTIVLFVGVYSTTSIIEYSGSPDVMLRAGFSPTLVIFLIIVQYVIVMIYGLSPLLISMPKVNTWLRAPRPDPEDMHPFLSILDRGLQIFSAKATEAPPILKEYQLKIDKLENRLDAMRSIVQDLKDLHPEFGYDEQAMAETSYSLNTPSMWAATPSTPSPIKRPFDTAAAKGAGVAAGGLNAPRGPQSYSSRGSVINIANANTASATPRQLQLQRQLEEQSRRLQRQFGDDSNNVTPVAAGSELSPSGEPMVSVDELKDNNEYQHQQHDDEQDLGEEVEEEVDVHVDNNGPNTEPLKIKVRGRGNSFAGGEKVSVSHLSKRHPKTKQKRVLTVDESNTLQRAATMYNPQEHMGKDDIITMSVKHFVKWEHILDFKRWTDAMDEELSRHTGFLGMVRVIPHSEDEPFINSFSFDNFYNLMQFSGSQRRQDLLRRLEPLLAATSIAEVTEERVFFDVFTELFVRSGDSAPSRPPPLWKSTILSIVSLFFIVWQVSTVLRTYFELWGLPRPVNNIFFVLINVSLNAYVGVPLFNSQFNEWLLMARNKNTFKSFPLAQLRFLDTGLEREARVAFVFVFFFINFLCGLFIADN